MSDITTGRRRMQKTSLGGVAKVYLFPFTLYDYTDFTFIDQEITVFPATTIYDYDSIVTNFSETTEVQNGNVAWNQSFSLTLPQTMASGEVHRLMNKEYRAIYVDRLGNIRILGLYNGLNATITNETGSAKADFNGYRVDFSGKEDNQAYFMDSLTSVGFTIYVINNKIFMSGCNAAMQSGNNYIYQ